jgi:hypothetical protein
MRVKSIAADLRTEAVGSDRHEVDLFVRLNVLSAVEDVVVGDLGLNLKRFERAKISGLSRRNAWRCDSFPQGSARYPENTPRRRGFVVTLATLGIQATGKSLR